MEISWYDEGLFGDAMCILARGGLACAWKALQCRCVLRLKLGASVNCALELEVFVLQFQIHNLMVVTALRMQGQ